MLKSKINVKAKSFRAKHKQPEKPKEVPMLTYGVNNNLAVWKETMSTEATLEYGLLGQFFDTDEYLDPAEIDPTEFDLDNDPHGLELTKFKRRLTNREDEIMEIERNSPKLYALMWKYLSAESIEEVLKYEDFDEVVNKGDPLALWLAIKATHKIGAEAHDHLAQKANARHAYQSIRQGPFETIVAYKKKFTVHLEAYTESGNTEMEAGDIAMDFYRGLDPARYAKFKAEFENDRNKGLDPPANLNAMFQLARLYVVPNTDFKPNAGVAFATRADATRPAGNNQTKSKPNKSKFKKGKKPSGSDDVKSDGEKATAEKKGGGEKKSLKKKITCWNCNEEGHVSYNCPHEDAANDETDENGVVCVSSGYAFNTRGVKFEWYEALLDYSADISVFHPALLTNVRHQESTVSGLAGEAESLPYVGELDEFFDVKGSKDVRANVLCAADVEEKYEISYVQGESFTVHMPNRDLEFRRRNKFFVADMRDWIQDGQAFVSTIADNESRFTKSEVLRARQARELVVNSGFSSEHEALKLANDGNVSGVPVTMQDIRRSFEIYGKPAAYVRGRKTSKRVSRQPVDVNLKSPQHEPQTMYGDIMYAADEMFVVCLTMPLGLFTTVHIERKTTSSLGTALQSQVSAIRGRGFEPKVLYLDPERGFVGLQGQIPGVEVDISGAGDHMAELDTYIRRVKEIARSVKAGLPWKLPKPLVKDLAYYATSRKNLKSSGGSTVCPRVKFTGRKPIYKKELGLGFGDYVECYDPKCKSNDVKSARAEPCIALYPTANANGSWFFLNLDTKKRVRRTTWDPMVTNDLVINAMNVYADESPMGAQLADWFEGDEEAAVANTDMIPGAEVVQLPGGDVEALDDLEAEGDVNNLTGKIFLEPAGPDNCAGLPEEVPQEEQPTVDVDSSQDPGTGANPVMYQAFHTSYQKSLKAHGHHAWKAIVGELKQLLRDKKALSPVHRGDMSARQMKRVIRSIMFLKTKFDGMGRFEKIKARLVANGAQQDKTLYPDTSSPTASTQALMMCLVIAARENRKAAAIDIGGAYLNAERTGEEVFMELEPGLAKILAKVAPEVRPYLDEKGRLLVKLDKALYGLLDSAKLWYDKLTSTLRDMGFVHNDVDPCVMNKMVNDKQITLVVYVDDILALSEDMGAIEEVVARLKAKFGEVKHSTDKDLSYLGMHLCIEGGVATVSMVSYLKSVLEEHGITGVVTTPATGNLFELDESSKQLDAKAGKEFHTIVAKLLYLAKRARIDVLLAVAYLCTRAKGPNVMDRLKLDRLLKYLNGTVDQVLLLKPSDTLDVVGYIDAAFGCHPDGKSHTGMVVTVGGAVVLCMSSKQKMVTRDSTEAELVGLSDKTMEVIKCADFMQSQGYDVGVPRLKQDNTSTITLVTRGGGQYRTKYLKVRQAFMKERIDDDDVAVDYLPTKQMLADMLTKPLQGELFRCMTCGITGVKPARHRGALRELASGK